MYKILYIDDEPINLMLFELHFETNYEVLTANSAISGLKILQKTQNIAIVVSDMKMVEKSGLDFIKIAKPKFPQISYYILSGYDINTEIHEALKTHLIKKYFRKPINFTELENEFNIVLGISPK